MYRNHEHYADPTFAKAYANIVRERYRPMVYICSPYAGDVDENVRKARVYCRYAVNQNCIPIAPHLLFPQFMDDNNPTERRTAMLMNEILLSKCRELWVFGDVISNGMAYEIDMAKKRKMTIRYFREDI